MNKTISVIAAVDDNYGFGKDGKIPWHFPEDFKFFKNKTKGATLIMGRATFDDLLNYSKNGKVLPDRKLIVLTSKPLPLLSNTQKANDITDALHIASQYHSDVFFIGGEMIFKAGLNIADTVYLTHIHKNYDCDKFFPSEKLLSQFNLLHIKGSEEHPKELTYKTYTRIV